METSGEVQGAVTTREKIARLAAIELEAAAIREELQGELETLTRILPKRKHRKVEVAVPERPRRVRVRKGAASVGPESAVPEPFLSAATPEGDGGHA